MWKCPKCKRVFSKQNQQHFCGEPPKTVDEYISGYDESIKKQLAMVRDCLREALPGAVEKISWNMPTYWDEHNIIHFAAQKKHIGLYPGAEAVVRFSDELEKYGYEYSKGSIKIPYGDNLPCDLIKRIAIWCSKTGNHA